MAEGRVLIKKSTLTEIGNAIREKTGKTDLINPDNMSQEIESIESGGNGLSTPGTFKNYFDATKSAYYFFSYTPLADLTNYISYDDTSEVTNMRYMFGKADTSSPDNLETVPLLNTSKVTDMYCMFYGRTKINNIPLFDTSNVTNMRGMFYHCESLKIFPSLNTSNVTEMTLMFSYCSSLTDASQLDLTSKVTNASQMFYNCSSLTKVPDVMDFSNATSTSGVFYNCSSLTKVPDVLDFSKSKDPYNMFSGCKALTKVPDVLDFSSVTDVNGLWDLFGSCSALTETPYLIGSEKAKRIGSICRSCKNLVTFGGADLSGITSASNQSGMFTYCSALENLTLYNIKYSLQIGQGTGSQPTDYGTKLTVESLVNVCKECIKQTSNNTLTVGSANIEKLSTVTVKFTDPTTVPSETAIAVGEKGDVVVCESTDEGAMYISEYMALKNWTLA